MRVGWVGVGQIGAPMVLRLLAEGHDVIVYARRAETQDELRAAGAVIASCIDEVAVGVDVIGVNVYDDEQLHQIMIVQGLIDKVRPGAAVMVHTTGAPARIEQLAAVAPAGVIVVDATFSGSAADVAAGRLTLMCGCSDEGLEASRSVMEAYGSLILHVGGVGAARRLKLVNNMLFAAQVSLDDEAVRAAEGLGLKRAAAVAAISASSGSSYALARFFGGDDQVEMLERIRPYLDKDVDTARDALSALGCDLPLMRHAARWGSQ